VFRLAPQLHLVDFTKGRVRPHHHHDIVRPLASRGGDLTRLCSRMNDARATCWSTTASITPCSTACTSRPRCRHINTGPNSEGASDRALVFVSVSCLLTALSSLLITLIAAAALAVLCSLANLLPARFRGVPACACAVVHSVLVLMLVRQAIDAGGGAYARARHGADGEHPGAADARATHASAHAASDASHRQPRRHCRHRHPRPKAAALLTCSLHVVPCEPAHVQNAHHARAYVGATPLTQPHFIPVTGPDADRQNGR
jgi:hypothetical protein